MKGMDFMPAGDRAMVVQFGDTIDEKTNRQVQLLAKWIETQGTEGVQEVLPTFRSLTIFYDPAKISYHTLKTTLKHADVSEEDGGHMEKRIVEIPCCYGGSFGEDLPDMEKLTGLSSKEIIQIHSGTDYLVYMLGFLPGFVYLGGLDERIHAPRLTTPRVKIPAGAVGIGGSQTGVYPLESPGGWRLIGSTPIRMYDPDREEPFLCNAGDYIRFCPIEEADYREIEAQVKAGTYQARVRIEHT
jgi:inhibitor of KinA